MFESEPGKGTTFHVSIIANEALKPADKETEYLASIEQQLRKAGKVSNYSKEKSRLIGNRRERLGLHS